MGERRRCVSCICNQKKDLRKWKGRRREFCHGQERIDTHVFAVVTKKIGKQLIVMTIGLEGPLNCANDPAKQRHCCKRIRQNQNIVVLIKKNDD